MFGYAALFVLAWFLGWALFVVLAMYFTYRILQKYEVPTRILNYFEHPATFEENLEVLVQ